MLVKNGSCSRNKGRRWGVPAILLDAGRPSVAFPMVFEAVASDAVDGADDDREEDVDEFVIPAVVGVDVGID